MLDDLKKSKGLIYHNLKVSLRYYDESSSTLNNSPFCVKSPPSNSVN